MFFDKPYMLFAPDLQEFEKVRGFYVPYDTLTPYVCIEGENLREVLSKALSDKQPDWVADKRAYHLSACDGQVTGKILEYLNL